MGTMMEPGGDLMGDGRQTMNPTGAAAAARAVGAALPPGSTAEEQLAVRFFGLAFHLAFVHTRERETARDLAQDTMLAVVRALREGRLLDAENLAGYVCGTARNLIRSYWRIRTRRPDGEALPEDLAGEDFEAEVERSERLSLLHRAIARLSAPDREVMLLTLDDGLNSAEISRHLGLSPEVLRQRKSRALKRVREMLGPAGRPSAERTESFAHGSNSRSPEQLRREGERVADGAGCWMLSLVRTSDARAEAPGVPLGARHAAPATTHRHPVQGC